MNNKVIHQLSPGKNDEFTLDEEYVAFKGDECYPVHISSKKYFKGLGIDNIRGVFSESGEILAINSPHFGLNGDFHLVKISNLIEWNKMFKVYKKWHKNNHKI